LVVSVLGSESEVASDVRRSYDVGVASSPGPTGASIVGARGSTLAPSRIAEVLVRRPPMRVRIPNLSIESIGMNSSWNIFSASSPCRGVTDVAVSSRALSAAVLAGVLAVAIAAPRTAFALRGRPATSLAEPRSSGARAGAEGREDPEVVELEETLKESVRVRKIDGVRRAISALEAKGTPRAHLAIVRGAFRSEDSEIWFPAFESLVKLKGDGRTIVYETLATTRFPVTRILLLDVVERWLDDAAAVEALHGRLFDSEQVVVQSAIRRIRRLMRPEVSVPRLIDKFDKLDAKARPRLIHDLRRALVELTRSENDYELAADWRNYWKSRRLGTPTATPKASTGRTVVASRASFFSMAIESDRVLFVIDVSGSMLEIDPAPTADPGRFVGTGTTVVRIPRGDGPGGKDRTRLEAVQQELVRTLRALDARIRFNILAFSHEIRLFDDSKGGGLIDATKANKKRAEDWVLGLQAGGATRTDSVLVEGLRIPEVDTIYLLSDGAPDAGNGQKIDPAWVLALIDARNHFRVCRIHAIGFVESGSALRKFLENLAERNDGRCVLLE
jgi:hypothetical protein